MSSKFKIDDKQAIENIKIFEKRIPKYIYASMGEILDQLGMIAVGKYMIHTKAKWEKGKEKPKITGAVVGGDKLNIRTGRLARSIYRMYSYAGGGRGRNEGIRKFGIDSKGNIFGWIGSKVPYAAIHEFGGTIHTRFATIKIPERSYIRRALEDIRFRRYIKKIINQRMQEAIE